MLKAKISVNGVHMLTVDPRDVNDMITWLKSTGQTNITLEIANVK